MSGLKPGKSDDEKLFLRGGENLPNLSFAGLLGLCYFIFFLLFLILCVFNFNLSFAPSLLFSEYIYICISATRNSTDL